MPPIDLPSAPRVLYIGGTGRTGSTVLDSLLGRFPGVFSGGELAAFWRYGLPGRCSCGTPVPECDLWSQILLSAFGDDGVDAERMVALRRRFWSGHLPLMVLPSQRARGLERLEEFPEMVERLYRAIGAETSSRLIVDSSKEPHYSYILREGTELEVYFLHLVRDPRAVAWSWRRQRVDPGFRYRRSMEIRGPVRSAAYYDVSNVAAEALWRRTGRYAFLRYEDFLSQPRATLSAIADFVGVDLTDDNVLLEDDSFELDDLHIPWGNPIRFNRGRVRLRADRAWTEEMGSIERALMTWMSFPLLTRYGYPLRTSSSPGEPFRALRRTQLT